MKCNKMTNRLLIYWWASIPAISNLINTFSTGIYNKLSYSLVVYLVTSGFYTDEGRSSWNFWLGLPSTTGMHHLRSLKLMYQIWFMWCYYARHKVQKCWHTITGHHNHKHKHISWLWEFVLEVVGTRLYSLLFSSALN